MSGAARSLSLLEEQLAHLPSDLHEEATCQRPPVPPEVHQATQFWVTGAGASEGPARVFVEEIVAAGRVARFMPLAPFALQVAPPRGTALVVFSQGLSPNARLALKGREAFAATVIVSAVVPGHDGSASVLLDRARSAGVLHWSHGPVSEPPLLLRLRGPARATMAALRLAAAITGRPQAPPTLRQSVAHMLERPPPEGWAAAAPDGTVALVGATVTAPMTHGLRWKLLEGAGFAAPPSWDVLQVAHGPLQQVWARPATFVALVVDPAEDALLERLESVLAPGRHQLLRLRATLPLPWAWFEFDAAFGTMVLETLRRHPRDLMDWPGKGHDAALYELGSD